jgi:hypothetical protein
VGMPAGERQRVLSEWIKPSSDAEHTRQERAESMVRAAINAHPPFKGVNLRVYPKGSYPNNTNVRIDSDVDIVVENHEVYYWDYHEDVDPVPPRHGSPYEGPWTPEAWRREVTNAIINCFGSSDVDTSGNIALVVAEKPGSRPSIDVVPSFHYYRYDDAARRIANEGSKVFKKNGGWIINWPKQQLENGRAKNTQTNRRYKNYVRALKNAENYLVKQGTISAKPSYLMECLVYNVSNVTLIGGDLDPGFEATLTWLWQNLNDQYDRENWLEPNRLKYLFGTHQKWTLEDAKSVVLETWRLFYSS